jgi:hypothetical protein
MVAVEAMALGQPLLRNRSGGWHEQLEVGVNGFDLGETGLDPLPDQVQLLQRLRDPQAVTNYQLRAMAQAARTKAQKLTFGGFLSWLLP